MSASLFIIMLKSVMISQISRFASNILSGMNSETCNILGRLDLEQAKF